MIEHLGTFATVSFWGWILGNGLRIVSVVGSMTQAFTGLFSGLQNLSGLNFSSLITFLSNPVLLTFGAGLGTAAGIAVNAIYRTIDGYEHAAERLEDFKEQVKDRWKFLTTDDANNEAIQKITSDFKTGFEEIPEALDYSSEHIQEVLTERIQKLKDNFSKLVVSVYNDVNAEQGKKINEISEPLGQTLTEAINGSKAAYKSLQPEMQLVIDILKKTGLTADRTSQSFKDTVASFKNIAHLEALAEIPEAPLTKMQKLSQSIIASINDIIEEFPSKIQDLGKILGSSKIGLGVELELSEAKSSLESFIKSASKEFGISENIISEQVFTRLKELAAQGNTTAQSLANGWKDATRDLDEFSQKAHDYVEYLGVAPEKFTPAIEKIAKGIQKIDPLTGKVTEQFKKAHAALKEWANVTFDKVAQRIQKLRKAVEGGFLKKESLEAEYKKVSGQVKAQIIMELDPLKKSLSESQYHAVLASEYQSRMTDLGGESFTEMMRKEFGKISGEAMGAIIERTAQRVITSSAKYTQTVYADFHAGS